jgi:hypothetical protein
MSSLSKMSKLFGIVGGVSSPGIMAGSAILKLPVLITKTLTSRCSKFGHRQWFIHTIVLYFKLICFQTRGPDDATLEKPPNHYIFDKIRKRDSDSTKESPLLALRRAQMKGSSGSLTTPSSTAPIVNYNYYGSGFTSQPPSGAASASASSSNDVLPLIPTGHLPGELLEISVFCDRYQVGNEIKQCLKENAYDDTISFDILVIWDLKELNLKPGQIARLRSAVSKWSVLKS